MYDRLSTLEVKIFADGADREVILALAKNPLIRGFTTNPTLMRRSGVKDYESFCRDLIRAVPDRPFSFEVFSDDFDEMERQALRIAGWGANVYVKIPITNTQGQSAAALVQHLARRGVQVNVTAVMTIDQIDLVLPALKNGPPSYISLFAGRIADSGCDPLPAVCAALTRLRSYPQIELIWASPREVFNIIQADQIGCHIITVTHDLLKKLPLLGRDLHAFSLETVKMFHEDAVGAGYTLA